ncbi:MAG TPA: metal-binding protein [Thermoplasmatales archaeon]|nr:UPF0058 family protein [Candidatus Thermoplasmatota archaeon]MDD5778871.1 UPF0058 family protein [Candidatus Thermoplasmatota archaeon]HDS58684.1 metal-binding protein [Thermoplasmatales archaeon]
MQKEEIIQLHTLFAQIKNELEQQFSSPTAAFEEYEQLGVLPHHVHKSKEDHKRAVFILGKVLAQVFSHDKYSGTGRVAERLARMETRMR